MTEDTAQSSGEVERPTWSDAAVGLLREYEQSIYQATAVFMGMVSAMYAFGLGHVLAVEMGVPLALAVESDTQLAATVGTPVLLGGCVGAAGTAAFFLHLARSEGDLDV